MPSDRPSIEELAATDPLFGLDNLPYGVISAGELDHRIAVRIGDHALDLNGITQELAGDRASLFAHQTLNAFMAAGEPTWRSVRRQILDWLSGPTYVDQVQRHLVPLAGARCHLAIDVADYVDFYASEHHARNLGRILRPDGEPLGANWKHLPVGYHGRAGTIVVSGSPVPRPWGQQRVGDGPPVFGPSGRLDVEAEIGYVVGVPSRRGESVPTASFASHVFGVCVVNDWSARDIQAWEYVPLGPFLGKSFATSVSAWITPLESLAAASVDPPARDRESLPYLVETAPGSGLAINLEIEWNGSVVSRPPFASMYWTGPQLLAHMTVNGASLRTGDLFASGTISGPDPGQWGSFIELSSNGASPLTLADGTSRSFLEDGDTVVIRATAPGAGGGRIALGEVAGTVLSSSSPSS